MPSQSDIETEQIRRPAKSEQGILVKFGKHKAALPIGTVLSSIGLALLAAWGYVRSEWADLRAADRAAAAAIELCASKAEIAALNSRCQAQEVVLAQINTHLATLAQGQIRLDARVAEIQGILMRSGR